MLCLIIAYCKNLWCHSIKLIDTKLWKEEVVFWVVTVMVRGGEERGRGGGFSFSFNWREINANEHNERCGKYNHMV